MRAFAIALARALAAMGMITWTTVLESGKLVWRAVRTVMAPPVSQEDIAEEEYARTVAQAAIESLPEPLTPEKIREEWGNAAIAVLSGEPCPPGTLDEAALHYLQHLPREKVQLLVAYSTQRIGEHLSNRDPIPGMPRVPSLSEYYRLTADAEDLARHDAAQEALDRLHVEHTLEWLYDVRADEPDPAAYNLPAYRPA